MEIIKSQKINIKLYLLSLFACIGMFAFTIIRNPNLFWVAALMLVASILILQFVRNHLARLLSRQLAEYAKTYDSSLARIVRSRFGSKEVESSLLAEYKLGSEGWHETNIMPDENLLVHAIIPITISSGQVCFLQAMLCYQNNSFVLANGETVMTDRILAWKSSGCMLKN